MPLLLGLFGAEPAAVGGSVTRLIVQDEVILRVPVVPRAVIPQIITYERQARQMMLRERRSMLQDRIQRAFGTLCSATMMTSEETMDLLSSVRLGINLGLLDDITLATVNELFLHTQPA